MVPDIVVSKFSRDTGALEKNSYKAKQGGGVSNSHNCMSLVKTVGK